MTDDRTIERRLLQNAWEEAPLWDTWGEERLIHADGTVDVEPPIPREEMAAGLAAALEREEVTLYDRDDPDKKDIALDEALRIVRDDSYWSFDTAPRAVCLFLTEAGLARAQSI